MSGELVQIREHIKTARLTLNTVRGVISAIIGHVPEAVDGGGSNTPDGALHEVLALAREMAESAEAVDARLIDLKNAVFGEGTDETGSATDLCRTPHPWSASASHRSRDVA